MGGETRKQFDFQWNDNDNDYDKCTVLVSDRIAWWTTCLNILFVVVVLCIACLCMCA